MVEGPEVLRKIRARLLCSAACVGVVAAVAVVAAVVVVAMYAGHFAVDYLFASLMAVAAVVSHCLICCSNYSWTARFDVFGAEVVVVAVEHKRDTFVVAVAADSIVNWEP